MSALFVFLSAVSGFACLALSMARHYRDLFGKALSRPVERAFRLSGWSLIAVSFAIATASQGPAIGPVLWLGLLTPAAQVVVFMLTYRDRWLPK
ncbi:DUF3325 domain-containing protein [Novosphingobium sp.]|uniref:DUF3325 domain-containing protein n=1 Tax=Novosphingobium sp. TaxID=1874826 RepID=UPI0028B071E8|nr:DUF3325 domain-containing protein [Novosphingobium sp.]